MSTREAADQLGVSPIWVRELCRSGQITALKVGRDWIIRPDDLARFMAHRRGPGKPKKDS